MQCPRQLKVNETTRPLSLVKQRETDSDTETDRPKERKKKAKRTTAQRETD